MPLHPLPPTHSATAPRFTPEPLQDPGAQAAGQGFDLQRFMHREQPLNPNNPYHDAIAALDADSLHAYCLFAICPPWMETSNAALLLTLIEEDFAHIAAVRGYIAHETAGYADGSMPPLEAPFSTDSMDMPPAYRHMPQDLDDTPLPDCAPGQQDAVWPYDGMDLVVLCLSNHEDAQPRDWELN